jgi:CubicO group peptidase (beta-lactamase class C family)
MAGAAKAIDATALQTLLDELAAEHGVPGATAGVLVGDELTVAATGTTKLDADGVPVTPDTIFLLGSITKVWTATLVMQLVDEGLVGLDDPVNKHLNPRLRLADQEVADSVTVRQLLTHSGGFYGDADEPPGRGDDAVKNTIESYAELPQLHRPGALFSYSNSGFNVLGRVVECLRDKTWDDALQDHVIAPLKLERAFTLPERAMVHRVAVGHDHLAESGKDDAGKPILTPVDVWLSPRGSGPCGGTLAMRMADLLAFARMHLADGRGPDGTQLLNPETARLMREPQVDVTDPILGEAWGLGWELSRVAEPRVVEHGGNTDGHQSQLYVVPDPGDGQPGLAIGVLTNGDNTGKLREKLCDELLSRLAGVSVPHTPTAAPVGTTVDLTSFLGTFGREDIRFDFSAGANGALDVACTTGGQIEKYVPDFSTTVTYAKGSTFLLRLPDMEEHPVPVTFIHENGDGGPSTHLALSGRVLPRIHAGEGAAV